MNVGRDIVPSRRETLIAPSPSERVGRFTLRRLSVVQWIGVVVAPVAWTAQHVVGYGVGQARCGVGAGWGIGFDTWQLAIGGAAVLLFLVSEAAAVLVFLATRETNCRTAWYTYYTRLRLGAGLVGKRQYDEAESLIVYGYEGMRERDAGIRDRTKVLTESIQDLIQLFEATSRPEQAAEWRTKLTMLASAGPTGPKRRPPWPPLPPTDRPPSEP